MEFNCQNLANNPTAKHCALTTQKLFQRGIYQLYKITLETGRKHQIRATFSFFQTPIVGDKKYGSQINLENEILLFAYQLEFNDLPQPLTYLNKKIFTINKLEEHLISNFLSGSKKLVKFSYSSKK
ncbi:6552_t:CDS:1 [Entrophospora sp. SA101]|nr:6552_t:CDS:1 [Entrophospora sp. SA101]